MNFIIDIGNSRIKAALFFKEEIFKKWEVNLGELGNIIDEVIENFNPEFTIVSSVSVSSTELDKLFAKRIPYLLFHSEMEMPFSNEYKTPETLGPDRLAGIMGVFDEFPGKNVLVIDMGSCITYDLLTSDNRYFGGAISPGKAMRFKSLNSFTEKLPLLDSEVVPKLIGQSSEDAILSGVINGILFELDGVINAYQQRFGNLTVIGTGGDVFFFAGGIKNTIFADSDLLLKGLSKILNYHKDI